MVCEHFSDNIFEQTKQFSSIWPIDRTLSGAITPGQSEPRSDRNKGYSTYPKAPALQEPHHDNLVIYPRHLSVESYSFAEMLSMYSAVLADWVTSTNNF